MKYHCKTKKNDNMKKEMIIEKLIESKKRDDMLMEQLRDSGVKCDNSIINNCGNTTNNTQNIYNSEFKLAPFGKEDLSFISDNGFKKLIVKGQSTMPTLMEKIHYNKYRPENHNVFISNMRSKYAMIYNGQDWNLENAKEIMEKIYYKGVLYLEEKYEELEDELTTEQKRKYKRQMSKSDNDKVKAKAIDDMKKLAYNKKHMPQKLKKELSMKTII